MSKPSMVCAREIGGHVSNGEKGLMSEGSSNTVRPFRFAGSYVYAMRGLTLKAVKTSFCNGIS